MRDYEEILNKVRLELKELRKMVDEIESLEMRLSASSRVLNSYISIDDARLVNMRVDNHSIELGPLTKKAIKPVLIEKQIESCENIILELEKVSLGITGVDVTHEQTRMLEL